MSDILSCRIELNEASLGPSLHCGIRGKVCEAMDPKVGACCLGVYPEKCEHSINSNALGILEF